MKRPELKNWIRYSVRGNYKSTILIFLVGSFLGLIIVVQQSQHLLNVLMGNYVPQAITGVVDSGEFFTATGWFNKALLNTGIGLLMLAGMFSVVLVILSVDFNDETEFAEKWTELKPHIKIVDAKKNELAAEMINENNKRLGKHLQNLSKWKK